MGLTIILGAIIGLLLCFLWSAVKLLIVEREKNNRAQAEIRALESKLLEREVNHEPFRIR